MSIERVYFGPGFSMTCAGQTITADADGFVDRESIRMMPEIAAQIKPVPAEVTAQQPSNTQEQEDEE